MGADEHWSTVDVSAARTWLIAATRPRVRDRLFAIYEQIESEVDAVGPACWASGRCCRFGQFGHRLYVSGLEAAVTVIGMMQETRATEAVRLPILESNGCRYQDANLCTARRVRPSACRIFFCDRSTDEWQHALYERVHNQIRALHEFQEIPYRYDEWTRLLGLLERAAT